MTDQPETSTVRAQSNFTIVPNTVVASAISDRAFRVYVTLRAYLREGHSTFPKVTTVCERFHLSESYVKRGIAELREAGLILVEKREYAGGFRRVNEYYFPDIPRPIEGVKSDTPGKVRAVTPPDGSDVPPPLEEEKQEEETLTTPPSSSSSSPSVTRTLGEVHDAMFEEFCAAHPKVEKPKVVRAAWNAAITKASPAAIIMGAKGYARLCKQEDKDVQYIATATNWLNDERWKDKYPAPAPKGRNWAYQAGQ